MVDPTIIGGVISALALILVARVKLSGDRDNARGPDWQAYSDRQAKDLANLKADMAEVRIEVKRLSQELGAVKGKFLVSIRHIYEWRRTVPDSSRWPKTPPELMDDLAPPPPAPERPPELK